MLKILCKNCNTELISHPSQARSCGCDNMTMVLNDKISANDLTLVEIVSGNHHKHQEKQSLTSSDLMWQEERRKRKVRKMEFEVR